MLISGSFGINQDIQNEVLPLAAGLHNPFSQVMGKDRIIEFGGIEVLSTSRHYGIRKKKSTCLKGNITTNSSSGKHYGISATYLRRAGHFSLGISHWHYSQNSGQYGESQRRFLKGVQIQLSLIAMWLGRLKSWPWRGAKCPQFPVRMPMAPK